MNAKLQAIKSKIGNFLKGNKLKNDQASKEMDRRYSSGWAQSPTNMTEFNLIKRNLK